MTTASPLEYETPPKPREPKSPPWIAAHVARILLGALFTFGGLNGFFGWATPPADQQPAFAVALMKTGYMMQLIAGTQLLVGLLFLSNRFVALAVVMLTPLVVNIVAFHLFAERAGLPIAIIVLVLWAYLVWAYRSAYARMFVAKRRPCALTEG